MLTIAVSTRSLFHLEESNQIFEAEGQRAFDRHMEMTQNEVLEPGGAFSLIRKLLALNTPGQRDRVEVIMLSRNSPSSAMRIMNSIREHGLDIDDKRAIFTSGGNRFLHAQEQGVDLFLSATGVDAKAALENGIASATILTGPRLKSTGGIGSLAEDLTVRIAFDGDSVIFSDEADSVFRSHGLDRFREHEQSKAHIPLGEGPFKNLVHKLSELRNSLPADTNGQRALSLALVTARSQDCGDRVKTTLKDWGLTLDDLVFADGANKGPLLRKLKADFFFDDTGHNVRNAHDHDIASAQVPFGAGGIVPVEQTVHVNQLGHVSAGMRKGPR